ncbi:MAG: ATP-dependent DNA ligase [Phycicoccus sp.]|nr:ATP-dependent DNA ligase [Phycicoccus sp.]
MSVPLERVVDAVTALRDTRSRRTKSSVLADLLRATGPQDAAALTGILLGRPRQGRLGVGWRTVQAVESDLVTSGSDGAADARLTLGDVDTAFTVLANADGPGSTARRHTALRDLLSRATDAERDLLRGAMLGDVRTGALAGVLTDALAMAVDRPLDAVRRAVMLSGSLGETAQQLLADPDAVDTVTLAAGTAVQPMLAATAADVAAAMTGGLVHVEHKLDGARIQVHRNAERTSVYTRSLAEITDRVPEIIELVAGFPGDTFILDGESLALDEDGAPRPFQETMSRFGATTDRETLLAPRFFDVLHLDGRDLIDEPLTTRLTALSDLVGPYRIPGVLTDDPGVAQTMLDEALAAGHEGVMVKDADSLYAAGRRGTAWRKVKPVHTLDLVVLAAEWGYGRRTGWLSNLHLGARDSQTPGRPIMVGKTFKGLTDQLLRWQTDTFPAHAVRETPGVVWLEPHFVVEIAVDGVQRSSRYPGGVALRFARVRGYRPDRSPADADTIDTVRALLRGGPAQA